jgi:hypothetical protein
MADGGQWHGDCTMLDLVTITLKGRPTYSQTWRNRRNRDISF